MNIIYFDNAATTAVRPSALAAAVQAMQEDYGNPSSLHRVGMMAEQKIRHAREQIAAAMKVPCGCIYFTSGGTEANNIGLMQGAISRKRRGNKIIASSVEHPSAAEPLCALAKMGFEVIYLPALPDGTTDISSLAQIADDQVILLCLMHVNNETGALQPVSEAAQIMRQKAPYCLVHSDLVQSFGKTGFCPQREGVHLASISGHKIGAPKGVGALYVDPSVTLHPGMYGGGQEKGLRPGTQNVPGIAAFGVAAEEAIKEIDLYTSHTQKLKDYFVRQISAFNGVQINGKSSGAIVSVAFEGVKAEVLLHALERHGVMVSSGSACASNKPGLSHVLLAMGVSRQRIDSTLRFSFCSKNTFSEIDYCTEQLEKELKILRRLK